MENFTHSQNLKTLRNALGLTQQAFADSIGEKQTKVKDIESGNQKMSIEFAYKAEQVHKASFRFLLTGEGPLFIKEYSNKEKFNPKIKDLIKKQGEKLLEIQEINNLTNLDMAKKMNISVSEYVSVTIGKKFIDMSMLNCLKENFDINAEKLLFGDDSENNIPLNKQETNLPPLTQAQYKKLLEMLGE